MRAAFELRAPALHEFPFGVEDHHGVVLLAGFIHRMVDVYVTLRIFAHAVSVAVFQAGGQFAQSEIISY